MSALAYLRIWLAAVRYSVVRTMMFRFDFFLWLSVDLAWMAVNLLFIEVIYAHTDNLAGWNKAQMILLVGTAMLIMRLCLAFFYTNLASMDRNLREGTMDFFLAQPGNPLFMIATRRIELDGLFDTIAAVGIVVYGAVSLDLTPGLPDLMCYAYLVFCGLVVHFSTLTALVSLAFWMTRVQGIETGYFGVFDLSKLPRGALRGVMEIVFVYAFPVVLISNFPAETLLHGASLGQVLWLTGVTALAFGAAVGFFHLGLRRYTSASS